MALVKCPRCELNYILDGGKLCTVCRKEVRGESEHDDMPELCSECGENPAVPGGELCLSCLKEVTRRSAAAATEDEMVHEDPSLALESVSTMDEIELDLNDDLVDDEAFDGEDVFGEDDDDESDEDDDDDLLDR